MTLWTQPLDPLHWLVFSVLVAAAPLALLLVMMGGLRKGGLLSASSGLALAAALALGVWRMPASLALASSAYGFVYGLWPIMWIVFTALWLYNLAVDTGQFDLLRRWMSAHASGDARIQAILVAFCFGALLEGTAGFGAPVAVAAFLLVGLGFTARRAVTVSLIANTAPVAFGALGIPVVALAAVTGLDLTKLSAMVGRQLPFLSFVLPAYLVVVVAGRKGLRQTWPAAVVCGASFALAQFAVSNFWGPYAADIIAALTSIAAVVLFLRVWKPARESRSSGAVDDPPPDQISATAQEGKLSGKQAAAAWAPWILLSAIMVVWSWVKLFGVGAIAWPVPHLNNRIFISLYGKAYSAIYHFEPLAAGTAALVAVFATAAIFAAPPRVLARSGVRTLRQLRRPGLTVGVIVALAYLYNYSGMAYTLGAALAALGRFFPLASGFLGWIACFLSGSDTASNLLFGNLQVAAAHQIHLNPILLAATNSSGAVTGKMISPQNIAVGVTTVGLVGQEGSVLRTTLWHSLLLAAAISVLAFAQAYALRWMIP